MPPHDVSADEVILAWREAYADRRLNDENDRVLYEGRLRHYETDPPSFEQSQALSAYMDILGFEGVVYRSDEERDNAYLGSFGTLYEGRSAPDLIAIVDKHFSAMAKAYDEEARNALSDISL